ncbi:MAG: TonB C-terminal domain-containing protein [Steroidobacteraceae bacterium]
MTTSIVRRSLPYLGSLALHTVLVVALVGWTVWQASVSGAATSAPPPAEPPAIEAVLVDASLLEPPPPPAEPEPTAADLARVESQRAAEAERIETRRREVERVRRAEELRRREAAAREAAARKEAARQEAAKQEAQRREAQQRRARETELQQALAAEEERAAIASARARLAAQWAAAIQGRVQRAWIRPPSARPGLDCRVAVTQVPGGAVVRVEVKQCNGDEAVRQSIEAAVMRASPLPSPADPAIFERELELRFRPND